MAKPTIFQQHTPGPWRVMPRDHRGEVWIFGPRNTDCVALVGREGDPDPADDHIRADARLIVRAVNAHADLLAALKAALPHVERTAATTPTTPTRALRQQQAAQAATAIRAAIARATGKEG